MDQLESVDLGNTDTTKHQRTVATIVCPGQAVISRLDFQVYFQRGFPESPYPSGVVIYCSDGFPARAVNVWPRDLTQPPGRVDMANRTHVAEGIRDMTASYGQYVNSIGYASGKTVAGRQELGVPWTQSDPASNVHGCVLKGLTLIYVYWFDGVRLHFDCRSPANPPLPTNGADATSAGKPSTFLLEFTAGLLAVMTVLLTLCVFLYLFAGARSSRSSKVEGWVNSAQARTNGYGKIFPATPHLLIPIYPPHGAVAAAADSNVSSSLLAHPSTLVNINNEGCAEDDELRVEEEQDLAALPDSAAAAAVVPETRPNGASRAVGTPIHDAESLFLPTSDVLHVDVESDGDAEDIVIVTVKP